MVYSIHVSKNETCIRPIMTNGRESIKDTSTLKNMPRSAEIKTKSKNWQHKERQNRNTDPKQLKYMKQENEVTKKKKVL